MNAKQLPIREKVQILASAIRSLARQNNLDPYRLTLEQATNLGEAQGWRQDTIAGVFYRQATDCQWRKVLRNLGVIK